MTRLRITIPSYSSVPGPAGRGFQFTHETGYVSYGLDKDTWMRDILKHRRDNGLQIPADMRAIAEDQLCQLLPPGHCMYDDGSPQTQFVESRLTLEDIWHGTLVLSRFVADGIPVVPREVAEARARTCAACHFNVGVSGCGPCAGLSALVNSVAPKTAADEQLEGRSCAVCKCASRAQVWLPIEVLEVGVPDAMLDRFPSFCWKGNGIRELRLTEAPSSPTPQL